MRRNRWLILASSWPRMQAPLGTRGRSAPRAPRLRLVPACCWWTHKPPITCLFSSTDQLVPFFTSRLWPRTSPHPRRAVRVRRPRVAHSRLARALRDLLQSLPGVRVDAVHHPHAARDHEPAGQTLLLPLVLAVALREARDHHRRVLVQRRGFTLNFHWQLIVVVGLDVEVHPEVLAEPLLRRRLACVDADARAMARLGTCIARP